MDCVVICFAVLVLGLTWCIGFDVVFVVWIVLSLVLISLIFVGFNAVNWLL